jgi:hypothetical protein
MNINDLRLSRRLDSRWAQVLPQPGTNADAVLEENAATDRDRTLVLPHDGTPTSAAAIAPITIP